MGTSRYGISVQAMHNGAFIGGVTLIMDTDARKAEGEVFNELTTEALRLLNVDAKYAWTVWFHKFAPEGGE